MKRRCICTVSDAIVRATAKRLGIPLRYAREVKRMHRRFKIHEAFGQDPMDLGSVRQPPEPQSPDLRSPGDRGA